MTIAHLSQFKRRSRYKQQQELEHDPHCPGLLSDKSTAAEGKPSTLAVLVSRV